MKACLNELKPTLQGIFQHLHLHPEVSWKEHDTTKYIANLLEENRFSVKTFDDCTGLIVELGDGPVCVGLRTDMDALWQEVDGVFQANHSCGHDAHMTIAIGTLLLLKKLNLLYNRKMIFLFQPAEEQGNGALKMIEKGLVEHIDYLYGVHLRPIQELPDGKAVPAIFHGAAKFIAGEIFGEDAHGARPHLGKNAIEVGSAIINELSKIHLDPLIPYSVKMTKFQAGGENFNIIPGKALFHLDLRAQSNEAMDQLSRRVEKVIGSISSLYETDIRLETKGMFAASKGNKTAQEFMGKAIIDTLGKENLVDPIHTTGSEDFHFYTLKNPNLKATMLGLGCDLQPGLHHPKMHFNREAIFSGIEILTRTILNTFESLER